MHATRVAQFEQGQFVFMDYNFPETHRKVVSNERIIKKMRGERYIKVGLDFPKIHSLSGW